MRVQRTPIGGNVPQKTAGVKAHWTLFEVSSSVVVLRGVGQERTRRDVWLSIRAQQPGAVLVRIGERETEVCVACGNREAIAAVGGTILLEDTAMNVPNI